MADNCTYFHEDFSSLSVNDWTLNGPTMALESEQLVMRNIPAGDWAVAGTDFSPWGMFQMDVDVETSGNVGANDSVVLYIWTSFFGTPFSVDDRSVDGVAAVYYPSDDTAAFMVWNTTALTWNYTDRYPVPPPVNSFGLTVGADGAILRVNGRDTTLKLSGDFSDADIFLDTLWLMSRGTGITARFDNVCADPAGTPSPGTGSTTPPGTPSNLRYTLDGTNFTIAWDSATDAEGYELFLGLAPGVYGASADLGTLTNLGPIPLAAIPPGTYYFAVRAYNSAGSSTISNEIAITVTTPSTGLGVPSNLQFTLSGNAFTLTWDGASAAEGYFFDVALEPGNYVASWDIGNTQQFGPIDLSLLPETTYYLAVSAYAGGSLSARSNEVAVTGTAGTGQTPYQNALTQFNSTANGVMEDLRAIATTAKTMGTAAANSDIATLKQANKDLERQFASALAGLEILDGLEGMIEGVGAKSFGLLRPKIDPATIVFGGLIIREIHQYVQTLRKANDDATQARRDASKAEPGSPEAVEAQRRLTGAGQTVMKEVGAKVMVTPIGGGSGWMKVGRQLVQNEAENKVKKAFGVTGDGRVCVTEDKGDNRIPLPAGDNSVIITEKGSARTTAGHVSVQDGQTTTINQGMIPTKDATPDNVKSNDEGTYDPEAGESPGETDAVRYQGTVTYLVKNFDWEGVYMESEDCFVTGTGWIEFGEAEALTGSVTFPPTDCGSEEVRTVDFRGAYGGGTFELTAFEDILVSGTYTDSSLSGSGRFDDTAMCTGEPNGHFFCAIITVDADMTR